MLAVFYVYYFIAYSVSSFAGIRIKDRTFSQNQCLLEYLFLTARGV